ncbi:hypothetical protein GOV04_05045 [Candidatus Woesearchaeota archaeon]|nr:hypothetical protein [Candidatus Woesearchaeota archaeon]
MECIISKHFCNVEKWFYRNYFNIMIYLILIIITFHFYNLALENQVNNFYAGVFTSVFTILIVYTIFLLEQFRFEKEKFNQQLELFKNFIFDLEYNLGTVANSFRSRTPTNIEESIKRVNDDKSLSNKEKKVMLDFFNDYKKRITEQPFDYKIYKEFIENWKKLRISLKRKNNDFHDYFVGTIHTFPIEVDTLNTLFIKFNSFKKLEYSDLRRDLIRLKHIYKVYDYNINKTFFKVDHIYSGEKARDIYYHSLENCFKFIGDLYTTSKDALIEIVKVKELKNFIYENRRKLKDIHKLLYD